MRFPTLDQWLAWQETLHPVAIDLRLDRIRPVAAALGLLETGIATLTIAGTNGKGSCVAYAEAILGAAGHRTGAYTSPHLLQYNERIRIDGQNIADAPLVEAFAAVDQARGDITLSYFEFGTLAALWLFRQAGVDVQILEVGLGGRLDAVNLVDADVALITSIGIDHVDWLGPDVESIGREKAGIFRPHRPAVFASGELPASVVDMARSLGTPLAVGGRDYSWEVAADGRWNWRQGSQAWTGLPAPRNAIPVQYANAAGVLAALQALAVAHPQLAVGAGAIALGLGRASLDGRMQRLPGAVEWLIDVAHNADSARVLAQSLAQEPCKGRRLAVVALLQRKDRETVLAPLLDLIDGWYLLDLPDAGAWPPASMAQMLRGLLDEDRVLGQGEADVLMPLIESHCRAGDQVLVFGSFRTVEAVLRYKTAR